MRVLRFIGSVVAAAGFVALGNTPSQAASGPTFSKDVAPILYAKCVECHRPSGMAPMSLLTYEDARPWARAVKRRTTAREMPPWGADPAIGKWENDPSLTAKQIETIATWVDGGAPEGDKTDLPKAPEFAEGWTIGKPDIILKMPAPFTVPADGTVPYTYITIPTNFKEDVWIRGVELRPTDRRVVHHIISDLVEGNGQPFDLKPRLTRDPALKEIPSGLGAGLVPGRLYEAFENGVVRKIPAGSAIVLQMHYTTIGQPVTDQTEVGILVSKEPPKANAKILGGGQMPNLTFVIPPGAPNHEVSAQKTFDRDTYLTNLYPHMHVRGKDVNYKLVYPDGREEVLLSVPKYDFNWQMRYKFAEPKLAPKGSTLVVTAHFDNSKNNRFNPDPTATVRWGDQTWEEMLIGYFGTVETRADAGPGRTGGN
jgi:hypothetical protein